MIPSNTCNTEKSLTSKVEHDKRIIYVTCLDTVSKDGIFADLEAIQEVDGFDPAYDTLADYSAVSKIDLVAADMVMIAKEMPRRDVRTGLVAVIVGEDTGRYILGKLFIAFDQIFGGGRHQIFKDKDAGEKWLLSHR